MALHVVSCIRKYRLHESPDHNQTRSNISTVIVRDVARTETGQLAPLIFKRVQLPPDLVLPIVFGCRCKLIPCICESPSPKSVPPRLIIQSPPPAANVDLDLNLDHFVDVNHSGVVYASSLSTDSRKISQFAIKFAGCNRNKNLLREAWFYDELQSLQGASVPRCYGYFHAILPAKWTIVPWQDHVNEINDAELTDESFKLLGEFNMSYRPVLARFERGQCLGLMLLECLGEPFLKERSGAPIPDGIMYVQAQSGIFLYLKTVSCHLVKVSTRRTRTWASLELNMAAFALQIFFV